MKEGGCEVADPIAVYGAITGTIGALGAAWAIWHGAIRDRARIRATVSTAFAQNHPQIDPAESLWCIEVMNRGRRPVSMSGFAGFQLAESGLLSRFRRKRWLVFQNCLETLPKRLQEGDKVTYWTYEKALKDGLRKEGRYPDRVLVKDDVGHYYVRRIPRKYRDRLAKLLTDHGQTFGAEVAPR